MRRVLLPLLIAVTCVTVAGPAAAQLPVGENDGVRIVRERGAIVVVFTQRAEGLRRRAAGRRVSVYCDSSGEPDENGLSFTDSGGMTYRMPRRGRRLRTGDRTRDLDLCRVWLEPRVRRFTRPARLLATIPLNQKGAVYVDELERTRALLGLYTVAALLPPPGGALPTPQRLVALVPKLPRTSFSVAALASPDDTPPAGSLGYYSDGSRVALVVLSRSGRRLFFEYEGDVLRTNVADYMYDEDADHYLGDGPAG